MKCPYCLEEMQDAAKKCPSCHEWLGQHAEADASAELERRKTVDYVRDRVEKALVRRYSWLGILVAALTGGLGTLLVNNALSQANTELRLAGRLRGQAASAIDSLIKARQTLSELSRRASVADSTIREVTLAAVGLEERLSLTAVERINIANITGALHDELDSLGAVLGEVVRDRTGLARRLASFDRIANVDSLSTSALLTAERARYAVKLVSTYTDRRDGMRTYLRDRFYTVTSMEPSERNTEYDIVNVGRLVPLEFVIELIGAAIRFGPPRAVALYKTDSRFSSQIFIGGFSSTHGTWSKRDLDRLLTTSWASLEELHQYIEGLKEGS